MIYNFILLLFIFLAKELDLKLLQVSKFNPYYGNKPPEKGRTEPTGDAIRYIVTRRNGHCVDILTDLREAKKKYAKHTVYETTNSKFLSDDLKFFPQINLRYFHLIIESIPSILFEIEFQASLGKKISVIMNSYNFIDPRPDANIKSAFDFFVKELENMGVEVIFLPASDIPDSNKEEHYFITPVKNYYQLDIFDVHNKYSYSLGKKFYEKIISKNLRDPYKIVYLSRADSPDTKEISMEELEYLKNDKYTRFPLRYPRIDDENSLKALLFQQIQNLEIKTSSDFENFRDQVEYFAEVKVLISVSGTGLSNAIFMQPGTLIVELTTPLVIGDLKQNELLESLENHYSGLAAIFNISYIGIPHDRKFSELKNKIEKMNLAEFINKFI